MLRSFLVTASAIALSACSGEDASNPGSGESGFDNVDLSAYLDCAREQRVTLLQAHRAGDRPGAAENSVAALNASLDDGAVFIELDVTRSGDGVLFLMHDDLLDRTTTGSGVFYNRAFDELSDLELIDLNGNPTGEAIPTLADALAALDGRGIAQIDRKSPASFEAIADVLEAEDAVDRSIIITYSLEDAIALHQRLSEVMISVGIRSLDDVETLREAGVDLSRITAWLGLGDGDTTLDEELTMLGIETSYGDFRAEREGQADYRQMAANGAEVISVDDVPAASRALDGNTTGTDLLQTCPAAGASN
ncbi:glycerophosphodiester phosphodiesterase family protein [Hyphobacterium sp.]|uniref:glycerophosphodiester phosphodiesterase family protein n=1 Tax=Hyphobacterium sp. TaxID=2004662 RepID=UPI003BADA74E